MYVYINIYTCISYIDANMIYIDTIGKNYRG